MNMFQSWIDDFTKQFTGVEESNYSLLYNNCGHAAMTLLKMGTIPSGDATYGQEYKFYEHFYSRGSPKQSFNLVERYFSSSSISAGKPTQISSSGKSSSSFASTALKGLTKQTRRNPALNKMPASQRGDMLRMNQMRRW